VEVSGLLYPSGKSRRYPLDGRLGRSPEPVCMLCRREISSPCSESTLIRGSSSLSSNHYINWAVLASVLLTDFLIMVSCTLLISDVHPLYPAHIMHPNLVTTKFARFSCSVDCCSASLSVLVPLTLCHHNCDVCVCVQVCH
jgi:hypothetical protein